MATSDAADHHCESDDPKAQLIDVEEDHPQTALSAAADCRLTADDAPVWRLKRLRPAFLSIGILACVATCLTGCAPLVPDLVREQRQPPPGPHPGPSESPSPLVSRLLSATSLCASTSNANNVFNCVPSCENLPALCRYQSGLLACQIATPACLFVCLILLALAVGAARRCATRRQLLFAALACACAGLGATVAFIACLHVLVSALSSVEQQQQQKEHFDYSADSTGARLAYAAICLQLALACQLACLPACLRRILADRAAMLAKCAKLQ